MDILLRGVPATINAAIVAEAEVTGKTRQDVLLTLLNATYGEPPVVVGWFRAERVGELDVDAVCPECGQPLDEVWAGLLSNGTWVGPRCRWCAVSE